jgi:hypothetical protein
MLLLLLLHELFLLLLLLLLLGIPRHFDDARFRVHPEELLLHIRVGVAVGV